MTNFRYPKDTFLNNFSYKNSIRASTFFFLKKKKKKKMRNQPVNLKVISYWIILFTGRFNLFIYLFILETIFDCFHYLYFCLLKNVFLLKKKIFFFKHVFNIKKTFF
jgi:hypothetical protein